MSAAPAPFDPHFLLRAAAVPIWTAIAKVRDFEHHGRCPIRPPLAYAVVTGAVRPEKCDDCVQWFFDAYAALLGKQAQLMKAENREAWIYTVTVRWCQDELRSRATSRHRKAKPEDQTNGVVRFIRPALRSDWLRELFHLMLADAGKDATLPNEGWSIDLFSQRKAGHLGVANSGQLRRSIADDIREVLTTIDKSVGRSWRWDYLEAPRHFRAATYASNPFGSLAEVDAAPTLEIAAPPTDENDLSRAALRATFRAHLAHDGLVAAMRASVRALSRSPELADLEEATLIDVAVDYLIDETVEFVDARDLVGTRITVATVRAMAEEWAGDGAGAVISDAIAARVAQQATRVVARLRSPRPSEGFDVRSH
jgi:hypothetical protein